MTQNGVVDKIDPVYIADLLGLLGVRLVPHCKSLKMRAYGKIAAWFGVQDFCNNFFLTLGRTIYYPNMLSSPIEQCPVSIAHEIVHVNQQIRQGLLLWLARYLVSQKFRWEQEREAYMVNVKYGDDINEISETLTRCYFIKNPNENEKAKWFENAKRNMA